MSDGSGLYTLEMVWPDPSPEVRQQVMDFWAAEGAIHAPEVATQRSSELVVVARSRRVKLRESVPSRPARFSASVSIASTTVPLSVAIIAERISHQEFSSKRTENSTRDSPLASTTVSEAS